MKINEVTYYLLSDQPSGEEGVVGWISSLEVDSLLHLFIDQDEKILTFKGKGIGYNRPWGGRKNIVIQNFQKYEGNEFKVLRTDKVGKHIWYYGILDSKKIWIHSSHLENY